MTAGALSIRPTPPTPSGVDTPHVTLTQVSHSYGELHAVGPIDLALRRGEFFSVVGPSGCGKSTLLDLLAGLNAPSGGTIGFEGKPVAGVVPEGIGVVFQEDASFPWLTVWDNIAFGLRRCGTDEAEIERRVSHAVTFMGLND